MQITIRCAPGREGQEPMDSRSVTLREALWRLYEHSGFAMAGAVAFSFVVSIFPFVIFLGALAGIFGGRELAAAAVDQLFQILPEPVAKGLAPEVENVIGRSRVDLLTLSGFIALFFATSAIETMRAALNGAYRVHETRPYPLCLLISMLFVFVSGASMLVLTWAVVVGPNLAADFKAAIWLKEHFDAGWFALVSRYAMAAAVITVQLLAFHLWLTAGKRTLAEVWPGVLLSVALWMGLAASYSYYLNFSDYTRFYAGLSQLMVALIFFQATAFVIMLGAEVNRGIIEVKKLKDNGVLVEPEQTT